MSDEERLKWLKEIEKDIYVCSLESTFADDSKSCAIHSAIEELEKDTSGVIEELEKIKAEIDTLYGVYLSRFTERLIIKTDVMRILDEHISELKGENNANSNL